VTAIRGPRDPAQVLTNVDVGINFSQVDIDEARAELPEHKVSPDVISTCPVCQSELAVTRLNCRSCGTSIEGEFSVGRFAKLSRDQLALLESFLRTRGNLRELERELGVSYPTVRGRVDGLVRALGLTPVSEPEAVAPEPPPTPEPDRESARRALLQRLASHEITAEEAAAQLERLRGGTR
jgi:hypothetical protein